MLGGVSTPARVDVACDRDLGPLPRLWTGVGFDEINWTYTPVGRHLLALLGSLGDRPFLIRSHYVFCSGTGFGLPHWGSGNVYHEDAGGAPFYDFAIVDQAYDAVVEAGHRPLVELGFTPRALVPEAAAREFPFEPSPTQYSAYEAGLWSYPPRDHARWAGLVGALVEHCVRRYGAGRVRGWPWELWNEPDIFYWRGAPEEYHRLYDVTAAAVRSALPGAIVGGPATTGDLAGRGPEWLRGFLAHCAAAGSPLDFVSFHTKGAHFRPWRVYGPLGGEPPVRDSPSSLKMLREIRRGLTEVTAVPAFAGLPCLVDECDASVPAHLGVHDNANFGYRNTEYYAAFQCKLMKKLLDLREVTGAGLDLATTWSFYIEGERCFEGTRSLLTRDLIEKPVLNAYRMLARLGERRLPLRSDRAWAISDLDGPDRLMPEEVDGLAAAEGRDRFAVLLWRHADDQHRSDAGAEPVEVRLSGLPAEWGRAAVRHWRVDAEHGNSHRAWREVGAPAYPTPAQAGRIRARQGLEPAEAVRVVDVRDRGLALDVRLPLPSCSLLEVTRGPG
jgi:xylan 1,4-beta-xylosidase